MCFIRSLIGHVKFVVQCFRILAKVLQVVEVSDEFLQSDYAGCGQRDYDANKLYNLLLLKFIKN